jgi:hypothetical protein
MPVAKIVVNAIMFYGSSWLICTLFDDEWSWRWATVFWLVLLIWDLWVDREPQR